MGKTMDDMRSTQKCLACGQPVNTGDPGIGVISQSRQAQYYHLDAHGCANAGNTA